MNISQLLCFFHTSRYLRLEQIKYRLYYRYRRLSLQPVSPPHRRFWPRPWGAPAWQSPSFSEPGEFVLLGEAGRVDTSDDWNNPSKSKLWLYNLHYLDDLNARRADSRESALSSLTKRWRRDNPPLTGNGWEPYPLSLRLVNLVKWYARRGADQEDLVSLALQAQALAKQLEYHILGNHLFANGKALVFVGTFLEGGASEEWLALGLNVLDREIREQFLNDGGHFELSPMYHATLLWDMCDLLNLAEVSRLPQLQTRVDFWRVVIVRGLEWLTTMVHPDGGISFFNDAAFGIAPSLADLLRYAAALNCTVKTDRPKGLSLSHLQASGYIAINIDEHSKVLLDVAEVGPRYQPGHAHADTLAFELSLFGQRVIVNSGISTYEKNEERQQQRGTAAHNTVTIDDEDSSEVWGGFRVARRAKPFGLKVEPGKGAVKVLCAHDGYRRLPGRPTHYREWSCGNDHLAIKDRIEGAYTKAVGQFHLYPDVEVTIEDNAAEGTIELRAGQQIHWRVKGGKVHIIDTTYHPEFGLNIPNKSLVVTFENQDIETCIIWK